MRLVWRLLLPTVLAAAVLAGGTLTRPSVSAASGSGLVGPLHTEGSALVDASGQSVRIGGVNWFGFETNTFAPHGLWARNYGDMLDQIAAAGFNTVRLPYTNELFDLASHPQGIDYQKNPDLRGASGLQVMDAIVAAAGARGLSVILDRHRPTDQGQSELWYTSQVPESRWIQDWVMLAQHYAGNPTVIGADLHNEPHGPATWGDGNPATDWRLAAERAGNAILAVNPDWLIIVEGIEHIGSTDWYWWGGNLANAGNAPVRLAVPNKLVYSTHDYGPDIYRQRWFSSPDFPANLPQLWHDHWAYLAQNGTAPVLVGEFGGRSVGSDTEGVWQRTLLGFLEDQGLSFTYWAWNPDSGDTGGLLADDWTTLDQRKLAMLAGAAASPAEASASASPAEAATLPAGAAALPEASAAQPAQAEPVPTDSAQAESSPPAATAAPSSATDATTAASSVGDATVAAPVPTDAAAAAPTAADATPAAADATPVLSTAAPSAADTPGVTATPGPQAQPGAASVSVPGYAPGGPYDPDFQHVVAGVGGPNDPDPLHRLARRLDEQRYLDQVGQPWPYAVYVTASPSSP